MLYEQMNICSKLTLYTVMDILICSFNTSFHLRMKLYLVEKADKRNSSFLVTLELRNPIQTTFYVEGLVEHSSLQKVILSVTKCL